jgi:hypothetical protein
MMIGIISAWIFIKNRVYVCPPGAACPGSINPDNSFLQDIRTVMQYWLHAGMLIFGVGLVRLVAYQAWSAMQQRGNTIDILGLNIGVINGNASAAANLLLLRRRNRSLGMFVLTHVAIISAISFVVGKSITTVTDTGRVELLFDYPMNINISDVATRNLMYGPTWAWLTKSATDLTFNEAFSGTFIVQDSRTEYGVNTQPSGQQISGSVSCVDPSDSIIVNMTGFDDTGAINITYLSTDSGLGSVRLNIFPLTLKLGIGNLAGQYLPKLSNSTQYFIAWFAITDGIIPNATEIPQSMFKYVGFDANLFIGMCKHTVTFPNPPQNDASDWESGDRMQYINASQPAVYLPPGGSWIYLLGSYLTPENPVAICGDECMSEAVGNTLLTWWSMQNSIGFEADSVEMDTHNIYCSSNGSVLSPMGGDTSQTCPSLDGEIWNRTLALVLDAIIQTTPGVGNASQTLLARAVSIGTWQWWLQGIIPLSAFILYIACLAYTVTVYWTREIMKELDLLEVVNATHAEEERLTKSVMVGGRLMEQVGSPS